MRQSTLYVASLLKFAFSINPLLYLSVFLSLVSLAVELAAVGSLVPLSTLALGHEIAEEGIYARLFEFVGIVPSFETLTAIFVTLFSLRLLLQLISQAMSAYFGRKLLAQLASRAFKRIIGSLSLREIETRSIGYFITLAGDESFRASTIVISVTQLIATLSLALLYYLALVFFSIEAAFGVASFILVSGVILLAAFRKSQRLGELQIAQSQSAGSLFLDALNGLRVVRAFSAQAYVISQYAERMFEYIGTLFRIELINLVSRAGPALLLLGGLLALVLLLPPAGENGTSPEMLVTVLVLLLRFFPVAGQALSILMRIVSDTKAAKDVLAIANAKTQDQMEDRKSVAASHCDEIRTIEMRGVCFAHDSTKAVFDEFSAKLERGKSYALVGPSGSGKSTLFDLLLGFYDAEAGDILINGVPISRISKQDLRRQVLLVSQQTVIFNDSVENNLRFGHPAPREAIEKACELAQIDQVIRDLPNGYDTVLNYQGTNLSGGQRQRIGIARALLRQPEVLLLDEVTAGLDHQTRDAIVDRVLKEFSSKIVVFATHDRELSSMVDEVISIRPHVARSESDSELSNGS